MEISARNQLPGTVTRITLGVERLGPTVGDEVTAFVRATEVMIGR